MRSHTQLEIRVRYDAPVHSARRVLRVLPLERPHQRLVRERWEAQPAPDASSEKADVYGNRRLFLAHHRIASEFRFTLECEVETTSAPVPDIALRIGHWNMPSRAVQLDATLRALATEGRALPPVERAHYWTQFCHHHLAYTAQSSATPLAAAEIWRQKRGSCADFAHLFLALCRASGLAARYVAGFNPAEGQMHAWAEVLLENYWHAFDPTHGRAPSPGCVAVAVGRDFYDVPPIAGTFRGEAQPRLQLFCRTITSS